MLSFMDLISRAYMQQLNPDIYIVSGIQQMPKIADSSDYLTKFLSIIGTCLYPIALSMLLPVYLYTLVLEKEEKLRAIMKMNGLKLRYYWIINYAWFILIYFFVITLFYLVGYYHLQFPFFTQTSFKVLVR